MSLKAGSQMPTFSLPALAGGEVQVGGGEGGWRLLVVYRGIHCPICARYLTHLQELLPKLEELGVEVVVVSADRQEQAQEHMAKTGLDKLKVGYGMNMEQMRTLELYVSEPRTAEDTDHAYPEPGLFLINPEGGIQVLDISNAPFARPNLDEIVRGIGIIQERNYPVRGDI